jgi:hypothetical protein
MCDDLCAEGVPVASAVDGSLPFRPERLIRRYRREVIEVAADGLQRNANQQFHYLLLSISGGEEVLDAFLSRIAAPVPKILYELHDGIELCVGNPDIVLDRKYEFCRCKERSL